MVTNKKINFELGLCTGFLVLMSMLMLSGGCNFIGRESTAVIGTNDHCVVARMDYAVSTDWEPPVIMGRDFWNMPRSPTWLDERKVENKYINPEPMVYESLVRYNTEKTLADTNKPLEVGVSALRSLEDKKGTQVSLVTNVPFMVAIKGMRPPFNVMLPFRADIPAYESWKKQHPNFIGFEAGCEWDNDTIHALKESTGNNAIEKVAQYWGKQGHTDEDIAKGSANLRQVLETNREGRKQTVAGYKAYYDVLQRYCFSDDAKLLFLRSFMCVDHYPLEWGAGGVLFETTNTGPYRNQISMFFIRGAARQYRKFWGWYHALCYNGHDSTGKGKTDQTPYYLFVSDKPDSSLGKDFGVSVSLNRRNMYLGYLNGASIVAHEVWPYAYCQLSVTNKNMWHSEQDWILSPHGEAMKEWYAFASQNDRGVAYAPVALALPFDQGYANWGGAPWGYFPAMRWDTMIDAFMYTLVPYKSDAKRGQEGCLANSPYGDIYDVLVLDPPSGPAKLKTLDNYKVLVLLGKYDFSPETVKRLKEYVSGGGTLIVNIEQLNELFSEDFTGLARGGTKAEVKGTVRNKLNGAEIKITEPYDYETTAMRGARMLWEDESGAALATVKHYGKGKVVTTTIDWMVPRGNISKNGDNRVPSPWLLTLWKEGGREMPFVKLLMDQVVDDVLPMDVKGDVEYGVNKRKDGWLVYLVNNKGVTKWTDTPETFDEQATAKVVVGCGKAGAVAKVTELRSGKDVPYDQAKKQFEAHVGPGDIKVFLITTKARQ